MMPILLEIVRLKKRLLILAAILLVLCIGSYLYVDSYQLPAIAEAQTRWNAERQRAVAAGRADVSAIYRKGKTDLEFLKARLPAKRQFARVLGEIMEEAAASGVTTSGVTYKPQVIKDEKLLAYAVTMTGAGRYAAVKSFLADLVKNREMVVVESFDLSNNDLYDEWVTIDLRLTVYLREET